MRKPPSRTYLYFVIILRALTSYANRIHKQSLTSKWNLKNFPIEGTQFFIVAEEEVRITFLNRICSKNLRILMTFAGNKYSNNWSWNVITQNSSNVRLVLNSNRITNILDTNRNENKNVFHQDWTKVRHLLKNIGFRSL